MWRGAAAAARTAATTASGEAAAARPSMQAEEVSFELGRMVAHCGGQHAFKEHFKRVIRDSPPFGRGVYGSTPAWKVINRDDATAAAAMDEASPPPYVPRLVGVDVEMVERRTNREKVPIKGALVESVFWNGKFHRQESTWLIDPLVELSRHEFDFKTETHGITYDEYMQRRGEAVSLAAVQEQVARAVRARGSCLVGHMILNDLMSLRLVGTALRNKVVDTAFYFGPRADGGASSLSDVVKIVAGQCGKFDARWASFRKIAVPGGAAKAASASAAAPAAAAATGGNTFHEPLEDAAIGVDIVEAELQRLLAGGALPALKLPTPSPTVGVLLIQMSDVRAFIGPGGANLKRIKHETGASVVVCTMSMPSAMHYVVTVTSSNPLVHPQAMKLVKGILPGRLFEIEDTRAR